jgi:glycosyltransferase involved in cell wall biosynthesis
LRVLYFSYNGLAEPLGRTQVLPYLQGLGRRGHSFTVISFEKAESATTLRREEVAALLPPGTRWIALRYHKRPALLASAWDILVGAVRGVLAPRFDLVHGRGTVAAAMAAAAAALRGRPFVFDVRGLLAKEYVDAGHWRPAAWRTRVTSFVETSLLRRAAGLVFLTERIRAELADTGPAPGSRPTAVIPCVADTDRFRFSAEARSRVRVELGLLDEPLMVYSGSLGSWYLPSEMLEFFAVAREYLPRLRFLGLTPQPQVLESEASRRDLGQSVLTRSVSPERVPDYLSAADFGISFIAPSPSKRASSPTKLAEYLACGLPVVLNSGVGDVDALAAEPSWLLVQEHQSRAYSETARRLREELEHPGHRARARALAERVFSLDQAVDAYDGVYARVVDAAS